MLMNWWLLNLFFFFHFACTETSYPYGGSERQYAAAAAETLHDCQRDLFGYPPDHTFRL